MQLFEFLPEGTLINTTKNAERLNSTDAILHTIENELIVEGEAILCDSDHNLVVDFGNFRGIIPHRDTAIGIDSGRTREIAVISRVGKPVSCIINGIDTSGTENILKLSRVEAQKKALAHFFNNVSPGDILPARITHLEQFGAFADIGCGNISLLGIEALSVSRISHPGDRFNIGDDISVVVSALDSDQFRVSLSHRELLGTWEENASNFKPGQTVRGIVRGVENYGIFVELTPNLSGLAEFNQNVNIGDCVSVFIKSIIPEKMKIKLIIIDILPEKTRRLIKSSDYYIKSGHIDEWHYSPHFCLKKEISTIFKKKEDM